MDKIIEAARDLIEAVTHLRLYTTEALLQAIAEYEHSPSYVHWSTKTAPIFTSVDEAVDCFLEDCDQSSELPKRLALYVYEPRRIEVDLQEAIEERGWKREWRRWKDETEDEG